MNKRNISIGISIALLLVVTAVAIAVFFWAKSNLLNDNEDAIVSSKDNYINELKRDDLDPKSESSLRLRLAQELNTAGEYEKSIEEAVLVFADPNFELFDRSLAGEFIANVYSINLNNFPKATETLNTLLDIYKEQNTEPPAYIIEMRDGFSEGRIKTIGEDSIGD